MKIQRQLLWIAFLLCAQQIIARQRSPLPESLTILNPVEVFNSDKKAEHVFSDGRSDVTRSVLQVKTDAKGAPLYEIEVFNAGKSHYGVTLQWKSAAPVVKGDVMLARLSMRTISARQESGDSNIYFYFQQSQPPHEKSFINILATGNEWKTFDIPFIAKHDLPVGGASIEVGLGALAQKVEISGVQILNFGNKIAQDKLPITRFTYNGREEKAEWRQKALKRIEEIRTAPLNIKVVDANGKTVKGAKVAVRLQQSDFIFGTAVNEALLGSELPNSEKYKKYLIEFFNTATIENGFKSYGWSWGEERKNHTLKTFEWLKNNGFRQRGHALVWPAWKFNPRSTKELALRDTAAFNRFIKAQFYERMAITKGQLVAWDVVNEYMHEKEFFAYLPKDIMVEWYQLARRLDPDVQLFINEYGMLNGLQSPMNIRAYIETIHELRSKGAPIDAIGVQGHVGRQPRDPEAVITDLDLFLETGLPVQITEFDLDTADEELQADYTRDFLIACYSHPIVTGITLWGFWDAQHWKPDAGMFRKDWTAKPSATAWREWVTGKWKTAFDKVTDKKGEIHDRGHLGTYKIRVEHGGVMKEIDYKLSKDSPEIIVQL